MFPPPSPTRMLTHCVDVLGRVRHTPEIQGKAPPSLAYSPRALSDRRKVGTRPRPATVPSASGSSHGAGAWRGRTVW